MKNMKKFIFAMSLVISMIGTLSAQNNEKAIGIRFGFGGEISYQQPLGKDSRLELDLGYNQFGFNAASSPSWGFGINGIYQWVKDLSALSTGFNWYYGFGGTLLTHSSFFGVGVLGQIGIEYNFNIPFQLSLDYRPGIFLIPGTDNLLRPYAEGFCLAARYRF
jgi:hypothetical protein